MFSQPGVNYEYKYSTNILQNFNSFWACLTGPEVADEKMYEVETNNPDPQHWFTGYGSGSGRIRNSLQVRVRIRN